MFLDALQEHALSCRRKMNCVNSSKWRFEAKDVYNCKWCKQTIVYQTSNDVVDEPQNPDGRGRKKVEVNRTLVLSAYIAGMTETTLRQFCAESGIDAPRVQPLIVFGTR
jgi:hypothetical protein